MKPIALIKKQFYTNQYKELYTIDENTVFAEVIEATFDEDGKELTPRKLSDGTPTIEHYFEFFTPNSEGESFIEAELLRRAKDAADIAIETMTVTIENGKEFDATEIARINMMSAVMSAEFMKLTETTWRLADNTETLVTLDELKEAVAVALATFGALKGIA